MSEQSPAELNSHMEYVVTSVSLNVSTVLYPANEYNIQEKIKEANQELFLEMQMSDETVEEELPPVAAEVSRVHNGRKVTFRTDLEDYEPDELQLVGSESSQSIVEEEEEDCATEIGEEEHVLEIIETDVKDTLGDAIEQLVIGQEEEDCADESECVQVCTSEEIIAVEEEPKAEVDPPLPPAKETKRRPTSSPAVIQSKAVKYKSCCEQKDVQRMLPKYVGHFSEYGLSQQQLQTKMVRGERRRQTRQQVAFQKYQEERERTRLNEEAFARWMRLKVAKLPKNKYANRYA